MGKKSMKKASTASLQQNTISSSNTTSIPTPVAATVANAATTMDVEETEPIAEIDMDAWEARFPFAAKTLDPRAQELDTAHELFLKGVHYANNDDLLLASEYIASAYLRDEMAVVVTNGEATTDEKALDIDMLDNMLMNLSMIAESESTSPPLSLGILFLILALSCGHEEENQPNIDVAMQCLSDMLDMMTEDMLTKTTVGELGGLTLAKVYYWRGRLYKEMHKGKSALKDWTKALELDPSLVDARLERLVFWKNSEMKTHMEIHAECVILLGLVHEDYIDMDVIYALLASTIYLDARLGTFTEAMEYYRKSLRATSRRFEVYGLREEPDDIIRHVRCNLRLSYEDPERHACKLRKELDVFLRIAQMSADVVNYYGQQKKNMLHNCQKQHEGNVEIQLSKCGRCTLVYCSKECIRDANWKEHKFPTMKFVDIIKVRQRTDSVIPNPF